MAEDLDISPLAAEMILQALRPVIHEHYDIEEDVPHDTEEEANV
jgi:hypothetical protein